jgi:3-hydroxyacyl-[acyl-carrier-protein] dehydratase
MPRVAGLSSNSIGIGMRWIWIDTFVDFVSGERASAVKNVTLAEEYLWDHFPGFPVLPPSLMIEGMAQTAGILVGQARNFAEKVILAKIARAEFDDLVVPGDQLTYQARIVNIAPEAAATEGIVLRNGKPFGRVDLMFSHVDQNLAGLKFPEENFVFTGQFLRLVEPFLEGRRA